MRFVVCGSEGVVSRFDRILVQGLSFRYRAGVPGHWAYCFPLAFISLQSPCLPSCSFHTNSMHAYMQPLPIIHACWAEHPHAASFHALVKPSCTSPCSLHACLHSDPMQLPCMPHFLNTTCAHAAFQEVQARRPAVHHTAGAQCS